MPNKKGAPLSERERVLAILKEAAEDARHAYAYAPCHYTYRAYCAVREAYTEFAHRFEPPTTLRKESQ